MAISTEDKQESELGDLAEVLIEHENTKVKGISYKKIVEFPNWPRRGGQCDV